MSEMHPNFPYGKGMWIWKISECEGGNVGRIISKCKANNISYVIVKCGDGENTWAQFTKDLVNAFHAQGIKIYSWNYTYGKNPIREASIAMWALDMGVDGHVFDAEGEYERLPDPSGTAHTMLTYIRDREQYKNVFLAHAPFPIIDSHKTFPYVEFGKYCDAVMPQLYWGTMKRDPENVIMWMYQQWSKWEAKWKAEGHADSIKPIIPVGQTYDNAQTNFVLGPGDIKRFIDGVAGYLSVNFWSFQHVLRDDCWAAIRDNNVNSPKVVATPVAVATPAPPTQTVETVPGVVPTPPVTVVEVEPVVTQVSAEEKKTEPELPARIEVPQNGKTTIEVTRNPDSPTGVDIKVRQHVTHLDYFLMFINYLLTIFKLK